MTTGKAILFEETYKTTAENHAKIICMIKEIVKRHNIVSLISDYELTLVIDEALTNAMEHGNEWNSKKKINVSIWVEVKSLHIMIEDEGEGFNFKSFLSECAQGNKLANRGRGLIIINNLCKPIWKKAGRVIEISISLSQDHDQKAI
jgi:serine/threonine-protein kinase RsbW